MTAANGTHALLESALTNASQDELETHLRRILERYEGHRVLGLDYPPSYDFQPRWGYTRPPHPQLTAFFARQRAEYLVRLKEMMELDPYFAKIPDQFSHERAGEAGWLGGPINPLDTAVLYYFVAKHRPRTYLEIGSGVTTLFAARAKRDHRLPTRIVSIDPHPRTFVDSVCDEIIREPFEKTDLGAFTKLEPGDIVFMDGSHRTFMNSDVTVFMLDVLPNLKPGVIVHFHDIVLPYDYPPMFLKWYWSEQYILGAYLLGADEKVDVLMPTRYISDFPELSGILQPILQRWPGPRDPWLNGGSLWFRLRDVKNRQISAMSRLSRVIQKLLVSRRVPTPIQPVGHDPAANNDFNGKEHVLMASKLIPSAVKRAIKRQTGISNLQNRLEGVSRRVDELRQKTTLAASELAQVRAIQSSQREKELEAQVAAMSEQVKRLQALYEYSILRPIDLVTFQNHYYFWYKNDATYPNASTRLDEVKLPTPFPFSVQEFWDSRCDEFPNWEQRCKFLLFAYFWLHDIDFTFLDIGANVGTTCIPCGSFIQRFGKKNRIYTFEPGMVGNLCRNSIVVNGLADIIQFEPRAVTKSSGAMVMHSWLQHSESNSLCDFRKHYPTLDLALASLVPTVSVDDFVQEKVITNSLFVKIDAEGQDWPVIQGMSQSLKGQVKAFMFELLPAYIKEFSEPAEVLESFAADWYMLYTPAMDASWNFRCFGVDTSDFGQFVRAVESSPLGWVDILLLSKKLPHLDELVAKLCQ